MAAKTAANLDLTANNKTDKAFRQVNTSLKNTARSLQIVQGPLGPVAGRFTALSAALGSISGPTLGFTAAIVGSTFALKKGLQVFAQTEQQLGQLEAQLTATGFAAGKTGDELERLAQDVAKSTLASLSEVRTAEGILLSFRTITEDTFDRALRASQDLAAAGFGSITDGAKQLGKALEDPLTGLSSLRRAGVTFSETQKDLITGFIEAGDRASAMSLILDGIEGQVGGAGTGAAGGLSGKFDSLTQSIENFWEALGDRANESQFGAAVVNIGASIDWLSEKVETFDHQVRGMDLREASAELAQLERDLEKARRGTTEVVGGGNFSIPKTRTVVDEGEVELLETRKAAIEARIQALQLEQEFATTSAKRAQEEIAAGEAAALAREKALEATKALAKEEAAMSKWHRAQESSFKEQQRLLDGITKRLDPIGDLTKSFVEDWDAVNNSTADAAKKQHFLNQLTEEYKDNLQDAKDEMEALTDEEQAAFDAAEDLAQTLGDGLKDATLRGKEFGEVMNDVLGTIADQLADLLIIQPLVQGIAGAISPFVGTAMGATSGTTGTTASASTTNFAEGGTVKVSGKALVGEKGPELVYLPKGAEVIPNDVLGDIDRDKEKDALETTREWITTNMQLSSAT
ncbi:phage tail length tape measure family protein, partial [bacterium]|nr:phage tail length tape measure family protein [bacterium]